MGHSFRNRGLRQLLNTCIVLVFHQETVCFFTVSFGDKIEKNLKALLACTFIP